MTERPSPPYTKADTHQTATSQLLGQYWTPAAIAEAMVAWATRDADQIFDPAVGTGAFLQAAHRVSTRRGRPIQGAGFEIDEAALQHAQDLPEAMRTAVRIGDFLASPIPTRYPAIAANPPYIRHQRLEAAYKTALHSLAARITTTRLARSAGLHLFFLIRCLDLLAPKGRLAIILPGDCTEGRATQTLWPWIANTFRLHASITFDPAASPFPNLTINPLILLIERADPAPHMLLARVERPDARLDDWLAQDLTLPPPAGITAQRAPVRVALTSGLARPPRQTPDTHVPLGRLFRVMRGIATGDNSFFVLTSEQLQAFNLPREAFIRTICRARDLDGPVLTDAHLDRLDAAGRPTFLLHLRTTPEAALHPAVAAYLRSGEARGLPSCPLIARRNPWYRLEMRPRPAWLFPALGRTPLRVVENQSRAVPLNSFLGLYPRPGLIGTPDNLTRLLRHADIPEGFRSVAKHYGHQLLKAEPRALERLPIPRSALAACHVVPTPDLLDPTDDTP